MGQTPYSYNRLYATRYSFISAGKRPIMKIVEFTPTHIKNIFNLGFGDLRPNGKIDDKATSNNGDIVRVLSTAIHIIIITDFTRNNPRVKIVFTGSTSERTALYQRILKTYCFSFIEEFKITALAESESGIEEVPFDHSYKGSYLAFFVKRII